MKKSEVAVLFLGLGFIAQRVFDIATSLVLARWAGKRLRADEL